MSLPLWLVELIKKAFRYRFLAAKLTKAPLLGRIIDHILFENDDIIYVPQDEVIQLNMTIERMEEMVLPSSVVEHFIQKAKHHWVMNWCICRASEKCKDYPIDLGCLFLGEASMKINSRLGHPVTKEEALKHIRRCQKAGLVNLIGRNNLDAVWLAVGPGYKLLTICNCCPCCCGAMQSVRNGTPMLAASGYARHIEEDLCIDCGDCVEACPFEAIKMSAGVVEGDRQLCLGCGVCVSVCREGALTLVRDFEVCEPLEIQRLITETKMPLGLQETLLPPSRIESQ